MLQWVVHNAVVAAALAIAVALVCRGFRLTPPVRHALWLIVVLRLVMPPLGLWSWPLPESLVGHLASFFQHTRQPPPVLGGASAVGEAFPAGTTAPDDHASARTISTKVPVPTPPSATPAWLGLWIVAVTVGCLFQAVRILRFRRQLLQAEPAPDWLAAQMKDVAAQLGIRPPQLVVHHGAAQPFLWCFGKPKLVWPSRLIQSFEEQSGPSILAHELAHLRRRDHWVCWMTLLAGALWWWYPLYWYVQRRLEENAESACDAWVVWLRPEDRLAYAEAVVDVWQQSTLLAPSVPAFARGKLAHKTLERRLAMIIRANVPRRLAAHKAAGLVLIAALVLPAWAASQESRRDPPPEGARILRDAPRDGDRAPRTGTRDGEGPARIGPRDGDRAPRTGLRDGEARRVRRPRDGDAPRSRILRDGEGRRESARRTTRREESALAGFKPETPREAVLYQMILQLQGELNLLRREVNQLKAAGPGRRDVEGDRRRTGDRPRGAVRREGDRSPEADAMRRREGDRPRGADRPREGSWNIRRQRREGDPSPEADAPRRVSPEERYRREGGRSPEADAPRRDSPER